MGLEEDLCPRLLDDLVVLGGNGDGDPELTFRRAFPPCGDLSPAPSGTCGEAMMPLMAVAATCVVHIENETRSCKR